MNNTVEQLIARIRHLEDEIEASLHDQGDHLRYRLEGRRILFEDNIKARHRAAKIRWRNWFGETELRHLVSAPFIYSMIVPLVFLDLFLFIYQAVCFRLSGGLFPFISDIASSSWGLYRAGSPPLGLPQCL